MGAGSVWPVKAYSPGSPRTEGMGVDGDHLVTHQPDDSVYENPVMTQLWMNASWVDVEFHIDNQWIFFNGEFSYLKEKKIG